MRRIDDIKADIKRYSKEKNETLLNRAKGELFETKDDINGLWNNLPLERRQEIVLAEKAGRLIIPPCKVGDTVYFSDAAHPTATIEEIKLCKGENQYCWVQYEESFESCELWDEGYFEADEIGKTVFLTREAAEAALKGVE